MSGWLSLVNLSDDYERRARFIPGVLALLPIVLAAACIGQNVIPMIASLLAGVGLSAVLAIGISHMASMFGNRFQERVWPKWPYDSPTNSMLDAESRRCSSEQRTIWYGAIEKLTGIHLSDEIQSKQPDEKAALINDAIRGARSILRESPEASVLKRYNVDYGFARNLAGLRVVWLPLCIATAALCWYQFATDRAEIAWPIASSALLGLAAATACTIKPYVRRKAEYYAEAFFQALVEHAGADSTNAG
ncbi:MAG: hypothetical protein FKY71_06685 [Spiribacter salinus]|uniref:Uncharacterized protein n=1 Tax=Spiribacter salinus TaxID=1335746 RepID=A0A540VSU1_9GAMM|nr:MAG: hypothetical protein FKY71_06685 [Spiribacter salinus]